MDVELQKAVEVYKAGHLQEAAGIFNNILRRDPNEPEAVYHLGLIACQMGRPDLGADFSRRALLAKGSDPGTHHNLGYALWKLGRLDEAAASLRRAIALKPDYFKAHNVLGAVLLAQNKPAEAAVALETAVRLEPNSAEAHSNLGVLLRSEGKMSEAIGQFVRAIELDPLKGEYHANLGTAYNDQGELDLALKSFARAAELQPQDPAMLSKYLYSLHFHPAYDSAAILAEHRKWEERFGKLARGHMAAHGNDRSPNRRLRVGYVSGDFHYHPVARFLLPLLQNHDHREFEVYCYSDVIRADDLTQEIMARADMNRNLRGLAHGPVAEMIYRDQIDILVDLAMHMGTNRMPVFALKPAPIELTYLAYCSTTGLKAIDYRLTDPWLDPKQNGNANYSERSVWLPKTYWCYSPAKEAPEVNDSPAAKNGFVTLACLNNFAKVSDAALEAWGQILTELPDSRLLIHARPGNIQRVMDLIQRKGIDAKRIGFVGFLPPAEYFALYHGIDITLDPFPYCGGTTTCDSLWMGVPVVTLRGQTAVGRGGVSILNNLGVTELVAENIENYLRIAVALGRDRQRLADCRRKLRNQMLSSPLMDAPAFARDVERIYREMWRAWCESRPMGDLTESR